MFKKAKAVFIRELEKEMNVAAEFICSLDSLNQSKISIAAAYFYRLTVNGRFVAFGPARAAHGYGRVDVFDLDEYAIEGKNAVKIEVLAYNCHSFASCYQTPYLCCEISRGTEVIAYTGRDFSARRINSLVQKVHRYSIQRHFSEIWNLNEENGEWVKPDEIDTPPVFIARAVPYVHYEDIALSKANCRGEFCFDETLPYLETRHSWNPVPDEWGKFDYSEIEYNPYAFVQRQRKVKTEIDCALPIVLKAGEYALFDFSRIECGFLQCAGRAKDQTDLVIGYTEYCENDEFAFGCIESHSVLEYFLPEGEHSLSAFDVGTARFAIVMVKSGEMEITSFGIKTYERDMRTSRTKKFKEEVHNKIYEAAKRTFAHNALDIYTDCPSRERAGWLCDSYFTAIAEEHFMGDVPVEDAYLENYRLCDAVLSDEGMLPMSYPSDVSGGRESSMYIPQWCMWYVLECREYLTCRRPNVDRELFRKSIMGIVNCLERFENADGLLQNLSSWNFVEWSDANSWVQDVNYPTNFLYSAVLDAAYELYGDEKYRIKAEKVRQKAAELSFDGEMFTDNAICDENGVLCNTGNTSEACQYYALLFGKIDWDEKKYEKLKNHVLDGFAAVDTSCRRFAYANAFIGLYLRIKLLLEKELYDLILKNVVGFFGEMADKTGTLWEHRTPIASLDHGFASYAAYAMCIALEKSEK